VKERCSTTGENQETMAAWTLRVACADRRRPAEV